MSRTHDVSRGRAAADVAIQVVGRALNLVPGVVVAVVLTRALGDEGFGQWSTALATVQIAMYAGEFGLEQVAVRHAAADPDRERDWIGGLLTLRLAIAVPVAVACAVAQVLIADSDEMRAAGLLLSGTLLLAALSSTKAAFQLRVRNDLSVLVVTINSILWTAAVIAIAAEDGGMVAFAAAFLGSAIVSGGVGLWLAVRMSPPRLRGSRQMWRELARIGVPVGIAGLLVTGYVKLDQVMLFALAGAEDAGLYGATYRILDQAQFIPIALMTTLFPMIAAAWPADPERVRRLSRLVTEYLVMVSLPVLGFAIVAAEPLVLLLFGEEFVDASKALPILMAAFVVICFGYLAGHLVIVLEMQRLFLRNAAIALVFNVVANLILIPPYGFVAAAWVTLATELLVTVLTLVPQLRRIELRLNTGRLARVLAAAVAMTLAVLALNLAGAPLGLLVAAAAVTYPLGLAVSGALRPADVRDLLEMRRRSDPPPERP